MNPYSHVQSVQCRRLPRPKGNLGAVEPVSPEDLAVYLALNRECEEQLSPLDGPALAALLEQAYRAHLAPSRDAMLIALDERARYESPNFHWFARRYSRFVYVDRVAVRAGARGRGVARSLYRGLIEDARRDGHAVLCAEVYCDPPNPQSDAFHEAMGFTEVGRAYLPDRSKSVRYLVLAL